MRITVLDEERILLSLPVVPESVSDLVEAKLTQAETEVLGLVSRGLSNKAIAQARGASPRTVANQLASVYAKLGISGRRELRAYLSRLHASRRDRTRGQAEALELWRGLLAGRWSLAPESEDDGNRRVLALRNGAPLARRKALTAREMEAWSLAGLGWSNKVIADRMAISQTAVVQHLGSARDKLGGRAMLDVVEALRPAPRAPATAHSPDTSGSGAPSRAK
jgi:DNA-binding CsgD family transcriptional regulator